MRKGRVFILLVIILLTTSTLYSQSTRSSWKRSTEKTDVSLELFHSTQAINLPTTEMLRAETFEFEIAHRFYPPIKEGHKVLFGLDGPATIRFKLAYGISNRLNISLGRSNLDNNYDLNLKFKFLQLRKAPLPIVIGTQIGTGWNTDVFGLPSGDSRSFQYYARVIINTMYRKKIGLGLIPTYLYNTDVRSEETHDEISLGINVQYYLFRSFSLLAEWSPRLGGKNSLYNPVSYGIELETGGHFFKILVSNSIRLNTSQYIAGSDDPAGGRYWHLGFNISRLLRF